MRKKRLKSVSGITAAAVVLLFSVLLLSLFIGQQVWAKTVYTNPETGYRVVMEDTAGLLTAEEESMLAEKMQAITAWGNAAFKSISENSTTTERYIEDYYRELFGWDSGTVFLIDMDNRNIWLKNDGQISRIVTNSYSDTITDNTYRYASRGDYYGCAQEAFAEIETLLSGNRIAQPMKYISNALLAVILALLINFCIMRLVSRNRIPGQKERLRRMKYHYSLTDTQAKYIRTTKRYDPPSSDSGGSSGGGGGGGGSSGSGGGHSF